MDALFDLSVTGAVLYDPVRNAAGTVVAFAFSRLNPAAQRILNLPAQVAATYLTQFPAASTDGGLAFHQAAFVAQGPSAAELPYSGGYQGRWRLRAQRVSE